MHTTKKLALLAVFVFLAACARSPQVDEPIEDSSVLLKQGFELSYTPPASAKLNLPAEHSLAWPVLFQDQAHSLGNSMAEYQPYGTPYWHGGCDLRVDEGADVKAPVAGRIEAGHYSYAMKPDGSKDKYWKPWPQTGSDTYFEVAVIADDGTRYEFHHVNRQTLPQRIVDLLNAGGGRVEAGELLGHAIRWADGVYHHIHYNVIAPGGVILNPEYFSQLIPDHQKPAVRGVYAVMSSGQVKEFGNGEFSERPAEFVVAVSDNKDVNTYVQPPSRAELKFASGEKSGWDFRFALSQAGGVFPALFDFYAKSIRTPQGVLKTSGGYGVGLSLVRLKVPAGVVGEFTIEVGDAADNTTEFKGRLSR